MGVLTAWALAVGIQVYRDVAKAHQAPLPSEFVASGAIFGLLGLLDGPTRGTAGVVAWGLLFAIVLQAGGPSELVNNGSTLPVARSAFPNRSGGGAGGGGAAAPAPSKRQGATGHNQTGRAA